MGENGEAAKGEALYHEGLYHYASLLAQVLLATSTTICILV